MTDVFVACEQLHLWVTRASGEEQRDPVGKFESENSYDFT